MGSCQLLALDGKQFRLDVELQAPWMDWERLCIRTRMNGTLLITPVTGPACQHVGAAMMRLGAWPQQDSEASPGQQQNVNFACSLWLKHGQSSNGQLIQKHGQNPWP